MQFKDRVHAGLVLARELMQQDICHDAVAIGIARGGLPLAKEIAMFCSCPLDVIVIKKIGAPHNSEFAIGAVAQNALYIDHQTLRQLGLTEEDITDAVIVKKQERHEKEHAIRKYKKKIAVRGKRVLLVDDGVATGATVYAALLSLRKEQVKEVFLVTPVIAKSSYDELKHAFDGIVTLFIDNNLSSVGTYYDNFSQVNDNEVKKILQSSL